MLNALDIAKYILSKTISEEEEKDISHLKLQKLLYYCQGFHLAIFNQPLFDDKIVHWDHGPVVPSVYKKYKSYGNSVLPALEGCEKIAPASKNVIDEVLQVYDQFSPWKLREMTHREDPWLQTDDCQVITHEKLSNYFKARLIVDGQK